MIETPVTIPSVPSAPMKSCLRSYPVLSLRSAPALPSPGMFKLNTVPFASGRTASIPSTVPWSDPYLKRRRPPALVEMLPAMWHDPFAPRSSGIM